MAYRRSSRRSGGYTRTTTRRSPARRTTRRTSRRVAAPTVRLVIEQRPASAVSRPEMAGKTEISGRKAKL